MSRSRCKPVGIGGEAVRHGPCSAEPARVAAHLLPEVAPSRLQERVPGRRLEAQHRARFAVERTSAGQRGEALVGGDMLGEQDEPPQRHRRRRPPRPRRRRPGRRAARRPGRAGRSGRGRRSAGRRRRAATTRTAARWPRATVSDGRARSAVARRPVVPPPREQPLARREHVARALGEASPLGGGTWSSEPAYSISSVPSDGRGARTVTWTRMRSSAAARRVAAPGQRVAGHTGGVDAGERRPQERRRDRPEVLARVPMLAFEQQQRRAGAHARRARRPTRARPDGREVDGRPSRAASPGSASRSPRSRRRSARRTGRRRRTRRGAGRGTPPSPRRPSRSR